MSTEPKCPVATAQALRSPVELQADRRVIRIEAPFRVGTEDSWIEAQPTTTDQLELTYQLNYECPSIGQQTFSTIITRENYTSQITAARTFVLLEEAQEMKKLGIGQRVTYQDVVVFDDAGPLESGHRLNSQMVFALLQQIVKTKPSRMSA